MSSSRGSEAAELSAELKRLLEQTQAAKRGRVPPTPPSLRSLQGKKPEVLQDVQQAHQRRPLPLFGVSRS